MYRLYDKWFRLLIFIIIILLIFCLLYIKLIKIDDNITDSDFYTFSTTHRISSSSVSNQKRYVTKSLLELGSIPELSDHIIFFNRIPKTGSEMLVMLIQWLQGHNNFRHVRLLNDANKRLLTRLEQVIKIFFLIIYLLLTLLCGGKTC